MDKALTLNSFLKMQILALVGGQCSEPTVLIVGYGKLLPWVNKDSIIQKTLDK